MNQISASLGRELWVFVSPIIHVNNDIEDFGEVVNWNGVIWPHIQDRVTHIFPDR
jgi:hypothetical protein